MLDRHRCVRRVTLLRIVIPWLLFLLLTGNASGDAADVPQWSGPPVPVTDVIFRVEDSHPDGFDWLGCAAVLVRLKPGDLLTPQRLAQSREALEDFAKVGVEVDLQPQGAVVTFGIQPYKRIKSIDVSGAYPLFEKDVRTAMTITSGDIFRPAGMADQEALIAERYRVEGYIDPQVRIQWKQEADSGYYRLLVAIEKGAYYVLKQVRLHGNNAYEDAYIIGRLKTWRKSTFGLGIGRFVARQLKEDIDKLTVFYRKQGYADVIIASDVTYDSQRQTVVCDLNIEEGSRYVVRFKGNRFYSDFRLRRNLVLFEKGNLGNMGIRRSIQNIRRRYLTAGFADVQLRWDASSVANDASGATEVAIEIDEGRRHIVEQVSILGNAHLDDATIGKQMLTRPPQGLTKGAYVQEVLHEDVLAIRALYQSKGFLGAQVSEEVHIDEASAKVQVVIHIAEGVQTRVGNVLIGGDSPVATEALEAKISLKKGDIFVPFQLRNDENELAARISLAGYPYVSVTGTTAMSQDGTRVDIVYQVDAGSFVKVGQLFFFGNFQTRERFLKREMGIDSGAPFDLRQVLEAQRRLRDLNVFDSVQVRTVGLKEKDDTVHLLVRSSEKRPYYLEVGGGYQTDKGIFGRAKVGDHNFLGTGKDLSLSGEASEVGYRYEANLFEPRLLGTQISASAGIYLERSQPFNQDFGVDTSGANLNFSRDWGPFIRTVLANQFERRQQFLRDDTAAGAYQDEAAFEPRRIITTTPSIQWDNRDSFIRPQRGLLASLAVDLSKGMDNSLDDFVKYRFDARSFYPLIRRVVLAGRLSAGYLESYGGDLPPQDQLFFLGGANTVRGFDQNLLRYDAEGKAVGGRMVLSASLETRIDIGYSFELIPFVDTGSVQQPLVEDGNDGFRWSYGLGLQYITPIGPMGIFYGQKIDRRPGESSGYWHLSIGYTF